MNLERSGSTNSKLRTHNPQLSTLGPALAMAGVNVIWGAAFPLTKPALATIPPFTFALLRFSVALAVLRGRDGRRLAVMGLLGFCAAQLAQTLALSLSPASDIALLSTASPL